MDGIDVFRPRFLSLPGIGRSLDGLSMAACTFATVRRLQRERGINVIDAHFAHPDGEAAVRIGRWLKLPVTVTMRGTEVPHSRQPQLRRRIARTLQQADRVFSVSESLRQLALSLGAPAERTEVVGNGIDVTRFQPVDKAEARHRLGLPLDAQVLISVGALVERKGMHRVIECLPALMHEAPEPSLSDRRRPRTRGRYQPIELQVACGNAGLVGARALPWAGCARRTQMAA